MEKEALIENLKEKVGENDFSVLSTQTVDALVTTFLPSFADDEKITDETWKTPVEVFRNYAGQYRHDLATKATDEKARLVKENEEVLKSLTEKQLAKIRAEWEKSHKTESSDEKKSDNVTDAVTKALKEYNEKLFGEDGKSGLIGGQLSATSEFIANSKKTAEAEKISNIKQSLKEFLLEDRKASRDKVVNLSVRDLDVKPDSDIDKLKVEVEKIYEAYYKDFYGDSGKPFGGDSAGNAGENSGNSEVSEYLKKRGESTAKQAEIAQKIKDKLR